MKEQVTEYLYSKDVEIPQYEHPSKYEMSMLNYFTRNITTHLSDINSVAGKIMGIISLSRKYNIKLLEYPHYTVPFLIGIDCVTQKQARQLVKDLKMSSLPVLIWPDLPFEALESDLKSNSIELLKTRIFIPVHYDLINSKTFIKHLGEVFDIPQK